MLDRFTADARQHPMWKSMKSYVTYKPLNAVGHKAFDFTVKGHDGKKITLSKVLKKTRLYSLTSGLHGVVRAGLLFLT